MNKKEKSISAFNKVIDLFCCPICQQSMKIIADKSIICTNNHTFDFAKHGYLNLLNRSTKQNYDKNLFTARKKMIMESHLYASLHEEIATLIEEHSSNNSMPEVIFDAGCGEGSHLTKLIELYPKKAVTGIGLDIAKEGVAMAAKNYINSHWLVGDLANIPLVDASCHLILNMLSPANYTEFNRVLAPGGIIVKIVPRPNYLRELREVIFSEGNRRTYRNDDTTALFKGNFELVHESKFHYIKQVQHEEIPALLQMTPLGWNAAQEQITSLLEGEDFSITVDLDILVGKI